MRDPAGVKYTIKNDFKLSLWNSTPQSKNLEKSPNSKTNSVQEKWKCNRALSKLNRGFVW